MIATATSRYFADEPSANHGATALAGWCGVFPAAGPRGNLTFLRREGPPVARGDQSTSLRKTRPPVALGGPV